MFHRLILPIFAMLMLAFPLPAQQYAPDRTATGGATTLQDIMARQRGQRVDPAYRAGNTGAGNTAADITAPLGTLGGPSKSDIYRALRYGSAKVTVSSRDPAAKVIIQDNGMWWLQFRQGPLSQYGAWLLAATVGALALFFLLRGRIRIEGARTGRKILRFSSFERFGHWLTAGSFILLALSGLTTLFGRPWLIPVLGHDAFSTLATGTKWVHNNVAWAFMTGLAIITVNWIAHNIPDRTDLVWLAKGGGLFSKGVHPPSRKFNAGQKLIFWGVVMLGISISITGLSQLFPFQFPIFGWTFSFLNDLGAPGWVGLPPLTATVTPTEEMQYAQIWHVAVAFVFIAMIMAHIYLGTLGMEGAIDAMVSGEVEEQWAREHHGLWVDEINAEPTDAETSR